MNEWMDKWMNEWKENAYVRLELAKDKGRKEENLEKAREESQNKREIRKRKHRENVSVYLLIFFFK